MKTKLDKVQSNIKEDIRKPFRWAKGFKHLGKWVYHPYTLQNQ